MCTDEDDQELCYAEPVPIISKPGTDGKFVVTGQCSHCGNTIAVAFKEVEFGFFWNMAECPNDECSKPVKMYNVDKICGTVIGTLFVLSVFASLYSTIYRE